MQPLLTLSGHGVGIILTDTYLPSDDACRQEAFRRVKTAVLQVIVRPCQGNSLGMDVGARATSVQEASIAVMPAYHGLLGQLDVYALRFLHCTPPSSQISR